MKVKSDSSLHDLEILLALSPSVSSDHDPLEEESLECDPSVSSDQDWDMADLWLYFPFLERRDSSLELDFCLNFDLSLYMVMMMCSNLLFCLACDSALSLILAQLSSGCSELIVSISISISISMFYDLKNQMFLKEFFELQTVVLIHGLETERKYVYQFQ